MTDREREVLNQMAALAMRHQLDDIDHGYTVEQAKLLSCARGHIAQAIHSMHSIEDCQQCITRFHRQLQEFLNLVAKSL